MFKKIMFTTHYSSIFSSTLDVEFKIPDCNKCEKGMIAAISNFKGRIILSPFLKNLYFRIFIYFNKTY